VEKNREVVGVTMTSRVKTFKNGTCDKGQKKKIKLKGGL